MRLREFQDSFGTLMLDRPEALDTPPADLALFFGDTGKIALSEHLKIYRNNIVGGLTETLIAGFPVLEKLVGKPFLEYMGRSFVLENPPAHGCLNTYGEGFDLFIESFAPAAHLPWLADMARLEIAMNKAYYAPDDTPLSAETLTSIAHDKLHEIRLPLRQSATLLRSPYALTAIRDYCLADAPDHQAPDPGKSGVHLLIYRPDLETLIVDLENSEYAILENLTRGINLGEALEHVLEENPNFDAGRFLGRHLNIGTFSSQASLL